MRDNYNIVLGTQVKACFCVGFIRQDSESIL